MFWKRKETTNNNRELKAGEVWEQTNNTFTPSLNLISKLCNKSPSLENWRRLIKHPFLTVSYPRDFHWLVNRQTLSVKTITLPSCLDQTLVCLKILKYIDPFNVAHLRLSLQNSIHWVFDLLAHISSDCEGIDILLSDEKLKWCWVVILWLQVTTVTRKTKSLKFQCASNTHIYNKHTRIEKYMGHPTSPSIAHHHIY